MRILVAAVAAATLYVGIHFGSTVGGGADSYGYISQAGLWRQRHLSIEHGLARGSPWPLAIETWAPLGYRPAVDSRDAIVPLYPPGFPLLIVLFQMVGGFCAAFIVVPMCGAATVSLTYAVGQRVFQRTAASLAAAVLVATSPIFLYQLMNPMSDVPVAAAWMASLYLAIVGSPVAAGLTGSGALLIRPNLVLIPLAMGIWLAVNHTRPIRFLVGLIPGILGVGAFNVALYGSALTSGYGGMADLYALEYVWPNVRQFASWLTQTQSPLVVVAAAYIVFPKLTGDEKIARPRLLFAGFTLAVIASYVFYIPFDAWWYLRFLLPAWPVMMLALTVSVDALARRLSPRVATIGVTVVTIVLAGLGIVIAEGRYAFDVGRAERRYIDIARFVATHTDPEAVIFAVQHSGTLRMYGDRLTLRFDQLDAAWLDRAVAFLQQAGRRPYFVLEGDERDLFRNRFAPANVLGRLDWQPMARYAVPPVDVFDPIDRGGVPPLAIAASASRSVGWRCDQPRVWPTPLRAP